MISRKLSISSINLANGLHLLG